MSEPLRMPEFLKRPARALRDNRSVNQVLTTVFRTALPSKRLRRRLMWRLPRLGMASAPLPNGRVIRMYCDEHESVLSAIHYLGWVGEEEEVLPVWFRLATSAKTILDIGAHVGHFSIVAGLANPEATIHSFEPFPKVSDLLKENLRLSGVNSSVHGVALGRDNNSHSFFVVADGIPSSSSLSRDFMASYSNVVEIKVPVLKLDDLPIEADAPTIMKIDTETTEPDVIAGAKNFISKNNPIIFVEVLPEHDTGRDLEKELAKSGYRFRPYLLTDNGPQLEYSIQPNEKWHNHLLIPEGGSTLSAMKPLLEDILPSNH